MDRNEMLFMYKVGNVANTYDEQIGVTGSWEGLTEEEQRRICHGMLDFIFSLYDNWSEEEMLNEVLDKIEKGEA